MLYRIYLCLDDQNSEKSLSSLLENVDYVITRLKRKKNLLAHLSKQNFDLLVISLNLLPEPETDSIQLLKQLPDTPGIVLLSENANDERQAFYLAAGCDAVLNSHLHEDNIAEAIEGIISKRCDIQTEVERKGLNPAGPRLDDFVSNSHSMQLFMRVVHRVVNSDTSLLILGETGVGKERLARAIHEESARGKEPFIAINCAALPDSLLESELFGHEQGAFTGAVRSRRGIFELAHRGTVFLDEIGDMPLHLQVKLLRVLQEKEFTRVGGEKTICVDIRIVAATNIDLKDAVKGGTFRNDLYYRLSVISLTIPPLRDRQEDIPELAKSYINYLSPKIGHEIGDITDEAIDALVAYHWPGNVRELINVIERAILLANNNTIDLHDFPEEISHHQHFSYDNNLFSLARSELPDELLAKNWRELKKEVVEHYEKTYLIAVLDKHKGNIGQTARHAGMTSRALFEKMQYYKLNKQMFKKADN